LARYRVPINHSVSLKIFLKPSSQPLNYGGVDLVNKN
jgi:hypothetical protein